MLVRELLPVHQLLQEAYGLERVTLSPLHLFDHADRGIYRVDAAAREPLVLRAYRQPGAAPDWLIGCAATLRYLETQNFPAPRLQLTQAGTLIGSLEGWSALLLSYIPGAMSTGTELHLQQLGATLATLHSLRIDVALAARLSIPPCRWQPNAKILHWLSHLVQAANDTPAELHGLRDFALDTLSRVLEWRQMPPALLHADPNPFNAVCTPSGNLVLIDWDGAGIGPAILDLGYLLITCHAVLPTWPQITPDVASIRVVIRGYCAVRPLTECEQQALPLASCFNDAVWAAQAIPQVAGLDWRENRTLRRFGSRFASLAQIGHIAQEMGAP